MDFNAFLSLAVKLIYYVLVAILGFFSLFTIYVLNRFGRNRTVTITVSLFYIVIFMAILMNSLLTLQSV